MGSVLFECAMTSSLLWYFVSVTPDDNDDDGLATTKMHIAIPWHYVSQIETSKDVLTVAYL